MESIIPCINNKECGKSSINISSNSHKDLTINRVSLMTIR